MRTWTFFSYTGLIKMLVLTVHRAGRGAWFASMSSREVLLMHATPFHGAGSAVVRITNSRYLLKISGNLHQLNQGCFGL